MSVIFCTRLKDLRKSMSKTQLEVSQELGVPQSTYAGYEINRSEPNMETLTKISDYFNVSIDYLLGKSDVKATQAEVDFLKELETKSIDEMIHNYNITLGDQDKMNEEDERKLIKIIKMFMEKD